MSRSIHTIHSPDTPGFTVNRDIYACELNMGDSLTVLRQTSNGLQPALTVTPHPDAVNLFRASVPDSYSPLLDTNEYNPTLRDIHFGPQRKIGALLLAPTLIKGEILGVPRPSVELRHKYGLMVLQAPRMPAFDPVLMLGMPHTSYPGLETLSIEVRRDDQLAL